MLSKYCENCNIEMINECVNNKEKIKSIHIKDLIEYYKINLYGELKDMYSLVGNGCFHLKKYCRGYKMKQIDCPHKKNVNTVLSIFADYGYEFTNDDIVLLTEYCFEISEYIDNKRIKGNLRDNLQIICDEYEYYPYDINMSYERFKLKLSFEYSYNKKIEMLCPMYTINNLDELKFYVNEYNLILDIGCFESFCTISNLDRGKKFLKFFIEKCKIYPNIKCLRSCCKNINHWSEIKYMIEKGGINPDFECLKYSIKSSDKKQIKIILDLYYENAKNNISTEELGILEDMKNSLKKKDRSYWVHEIEDLLSGYKNITNEI